MASGTRVLKDRYELLGLVATGGMGQVWRAATCCSAGRSR